ncbi:hypothetical protein ACW9HR_35075 [Nocardia gipuzkoensis]
MTVYDVARQLPTIAELRELCRSLAMLAAILSPDRESRNYSFNAARWPAETVAAITTEHLLQQLSRPAGDLYPDYYARGVAARWRTQPNPR